MDWHIGHYVKILMDEVFGEDNFVNEIVWCYTGTGKATQYFKRKHDCIFLYSKSEEIIFNSREVGIPFSDKQKKKYSSKDDKGFYKEYTHANGSVHKKYWDENDYLPLNDWWSDIYVIQDHAQREDYSTQKPEALLERIIKASSNENMLVADFFGGSGVAAAVAHKLGRKFIHCDIGINSIQTTRDRLKALNSSFDILEIKDGIELFRNPAQTMDKIKTLISGLVETSELDKNYWIGALNDSKLGIVPVYVPNLLDSSQKVLDKVLMNDILNKGVSELPEEIKKVIVYYIDIDNRKDIDKMIKDFKHSLAQVELLPLQDLLDEVVAMDSIEYNIKKIGAKFEVEIISFLSDRVIKKINEYNQKKQSQTLKNGKKFKPINISENGLELIESVSLDCSNEKGIWISDSEIKIDKNSFTIKDGIKTKEFWNGKIACDKKPLRLKVRNICGDESIIIL